MPARLCRLLHIRAMVRVSAVSLLHCSSRHISARNISQPCELRTPHCQPSNVVVTCFATFTYTAFPTTWSSLFFSYTCIPRNTTNILILYVTTIDPITIHDVGNHVSPSRKMHLGIPMQGFPPLVESPAIRMSVEAPAQNAVYIAAKLLHRRNTPCDRAFPNIKCSCSTYVTCFPAVAIWCR